MTPFPSERNCVWDNSDGRGVALGAVIGTSAGGGDGSALEGGMFSGRITQCRVDPSQTDDVPSVSSFFKTLPENIRRILLTSCTSNIEPIFSLKSFIGKSECSPSSISKSDPSRVLTLIFILEGNENRIHVLYGDESLAKQRW